MSRAPIDLSETKTSLRLLPTFAPARVFARMAELCVGDAEEFRERLGCLRREITVGSQVCLDDFGRGLVREIDDRTLLVAVHLAPAHDAFHRNVKPGRTPPDVV